MLRHTSSLRARYLLAITRRRSFHGRKLRRKNAEHDKQSYIRLGRYAEEKKGLISIEKISEGTRILSEEPIVIIIYNKLDSRRLSTSIRQ